MIKTSLQRSGTILVIAMALLAAGCSGYNKLLKSNDTELKYSKAIEYYEAGKYSKTIALLEDIRYQYFGSIKMDTIAYYIATSYYKNGDFETSGYMFDEFRQSYGRSPFLEDAEYMYARGYYFLSPPSNRDQTNTRRALVAIDEYMERYPASVKKETLEDNQKELVQKLHDKAYINAKSYYTTRRYKSAIVALKNALAQYPNSNHREEMSYLIVKSSYLFAENSVPELQRDRYMEMIDYYFDFVSEFPESDKKKEVDKMAANARKFLSAFTDENTDLQPLENLN